MSKSLTWANYAQIISASLVVYYALINLIFYRIKINMSSSNEESNTSLLFNMADNSSTVNKSKNLFDEEISDNFQFEDAQMDFNPEAQDFADEIVAYTSSCKENITKEILVQSIQRIIQKYPSLRDSNHKYELNQLISISTENYCSIHVSAEELSELWRS